MFNWFSQTYQHFFTCFKTLFKIEIRIQRSLACCEGSCVALSWSSGSQKLEVGVLDVSTGVCKSRARVVAIEASGGGGAAAKRKREKVVVCTGKQMRCKQARQWARARAGKHLCACQCSKEERNDGLGFREGGRARHRHSPLATPARCSKSGRVHSPGTPPLPSLSLGYIIGNLRFLVGLPFKSAIFIFIFIFEFFIFLVEIGS